MVRLLGIGVETADMLVNEILARKLRIDERSPATLVPARLTRAGIDAERRDLRVQATHGCAAV